MNEPWHIPYPQTSQIIHQIHVIFVVPPGCQLASKSTDSIYLFSSVTTKCRI